MNTTTTRLLFVAVCLCAISALPVVDDNEPHSGADFIRNLFGITDLQQHVKVGQPHPYQITSELSLDRYLTLTRRLWTASTTARCRWTFAL